MSNNETVTVPSAAEYDFFRRIVDNKQSAWQVACDFGGFERGNLDDDTFDEAEFNRCLARGRNALRRKISAYRLANPAQRAEADGWKVKRGTHNVAATRNGIELRVSKSTLAEVF